MNVLDRPTWLPEHLLPYWNGTPYQVLRATIVAEAESESAEGQYAVGCVVRNRALLQWGWSSSIVVACLQPWQFSCWWGEGFIARQKVLKLAMRSETAFPIASDAAYRVLKNEPDITATATHYFNPDIVKPNWASHLIRKCRIGAHDFYGYI